MCSRRVSCVQSIASYPSSCLWLCRVCVHVCVACWSTLFYMNLSVFTQHAPSSKGHAAVSVYLHSKHNVLHMYPVIDKVLRCVRTCIAGLKCSVMFVSRSVCQSVKNHTAGNLDSLATHTHDHDKASFFHIVAESVKQFAFPPSHIWVSGLS